MVGLWCVGCVCVAGVSYILPVLQAFFTFYSKLFCGLRDYVFFINDEPYFYKEGFLEG
jgi:hypothetical protein